MMETKTVNGGINRSYGNSKLQKWVFMLIHLTIVLFCTWLVLFDGLTVLGSIFRQEWNFSDKTRAYFLLGCAFFYWIRHAVTLFYLLLRKIDWSEVLGITIFIAFIDISFLLVGGGSFHDDTIAFGWLDIVAVGLLIFGSYLNSFSEIERKWWKKDPANKGHCYTGGLFKYSAHINYFGDVVLFTGWALLTYNFWTLAVPMLMAYMFIFFHIPALDKYLVERYTEEFVVYAEKTKKLIPFVY